MSLKKPISFLLALLTLFSSFSFAFLVKPIPAEAKNCKGSSIVSLKGVTHDTGAPSKNYINEFRNDFDMNTVRLWQSIRDYNKIPSDSDGIIVQMRQWRSAGFKVMVVFADKLNQEKGRNPTYGEVKSYFEKYQSAYGKYVDYWEMQNEPNLPQYWKASLSTYMATFQKGGWDALHPRGEYVVSAAIAGSLDGLQKLIDNGLMNMTDAVAFHPYGGMNIDPSRGIQAKINEHVNKVQKVSDMIGNKPLFITEWNIHAKNLNNHNLWAGALDEMYDGIKGCVTGVWYYHGSADPNTSAGQAGLIMQNGQPHQPFYNALKAVFTGSPVTTSPLPTNTKSPSPSPSGGGGGGNNPSPTVTNPLPTYTNPLPTYTVNPSTSPSTSVTPSNPTVPTNNPCSPDKIKTEADVIRCSGGSTNNPNSSTTPSNPGVTGINSPTESAPAGLVTCTGVALNGGVECNYATFIQLIQRVLNFLFILTGFIIVLMILWQGFGFLTSQGNPDKIKKLKQSLWKTVLGFIIVISSWLIVNVVANALIDPKSGYINPLSSGTSGQTTPPASTTN